MSEKIYFTHFELNISGFGDSIFKTCELKMMLLSESNTAKLENPQPNVNDLPKDMRDALRTWLGDEDR